MAKFTFRHHKLAAAICTAALLMPVSVQAKRLTIRKFDSCKSKKTLKAA